VLRGKRLGGSILFVVVAVLFGATGLPLFARASGGCTGTNEPVLAVIRDCPAAVSALGDDIGFGWVGCAHGSSETGGGNGEASWRMPVSGSKASGVLRWAAVKRGGQWRVHQANLEVGDVTIDAVRCAGSGEHSSVVGQMESQCEAGSKTACHSLGTLYETGTTVEKDPAKAAKYYARACKLGFKVACFPAEKENQ